MAPAPRACPVKDCEYTTPPALPNYDLVYKDLGIHLEYCHASDRGSNGAGAGPGRSKPKPDNPKAADPDLPAARWPSTPFRRCHRSLCYRG